MKRALDLVTAPTLVTFSFAPFLLTCSGYELEPQSPC
nr:MAG TPA: hypothetical protein [Bacteriophage sp.]